MIPAFVAPLLKPLGSFFGGFFGGLRKWFDVGAAAFAGVLWQRGRTRKKTLEHKEEQLEIASKRKLRRGDILDRMRKRDD